MAKEVKFKNRHGVVIATSDPSTINDYRHREGFTEVKPRSSSDDSGKSTKKS